MPEKIKSSRTADDGKTEGGRGDALKKSEVKEGRA